MSGDPQDDELVPAERLAEEIEWPLFRVRRALKAAGDQARYVQRHREGSRGRAPKLYPLRRTLDLLRGQAIQPAALGGVEVPEELVTEKKLAQEIGWSTAKVRGLLARLTHATGVVEDLRGGRPRLYRFRSTLKLLYWEEARVNARREREKDTGGAYWLALAKLKVASDTAARLSRELVGLKKDLRDALEGLRKRPGTLVDIYTLPDAGLVLRFPVCVLVAPLRGTRWKATVPEIPLRGEGRSEEAAVSDYRHRLVQAFRDLELSPGQDRELWKQLNEFIEIRSGEGSGAGGDS